MFYLKIKAMKRLALSSLIVVAVGLMMFMGCEELEPIIPNEEQQQHHRREDSLINQQGDTTINLDPLEAMEDSILNAEHETAVEHWKYTLNENYGATLFMDMFPSVSRINMVAFDTTGWFPVSHGVHTSASYSFSGDTITLYYDNDTIVPEEQRRWLVSRPNDTVMQWNYLGILPQDGTSVYYSYYFVLF